MPRPRMKRRISFSPTVTFYKPQGVPMKNLEIIELALEEVEALRLKDMERLNQAECAEKMKISQSTFQRILYSAQEKVATALIKGMAIKIAKLK